MNCGRCGWQYPEALLERVRGSILSDPVCGLCALEIVNSVHGTHDTRFRGEIAESLRLAAVSWRERHPDDAPVREAE